jgi:DNA adenine methylase
MSEPTRPILRYFGGKWRLAPWIIEHFPPHRVYVEPFGGAASVLLRKPRAYAEVYNDLDGEVVNLFVVARDHGRYLRRALELTPFAREEFDLAHEDTDDRVERARRLVVRSFMGFGADSVHSRYKSGFRANSNRSGSTPAHDWASYSEALDAIVQRLQGVVIENRDAWRVCEQHDSPDTLFYLDPPYVHGTRGRSDVHGYRHEMTDEDHAAFLRAACGLRGMVVVSGYEHPIYEALLPGWLRVESKTYADGANARTECLWLSPRAAGAKVAANRKGFFYP